jgi:hypothetical protein
MRIHACWSALTWLALSACAAAPPLPPIDHSHPASRDAPEAPLPPVRNAFSDLGSDMAPTHASHASHGAWVCPMHEDVTSDAPGRCPRCHMELVKRGGP